MNVVSEYEFQIIITLVVLHFSLLCPGFFDWSTNENQNNTAWLKKTQQLLYHENQ